VYRIKKFSNLRNFFKNRPYTIQLLLETRGPQNPQFQPSSTIMANQQSGVEGLACGNTPAAVTDPDDALPPVKTSKTTFDLSPTTSATVTTTISVSDNQRKKTEEEICSPQGPTFRP